MNVTVSKSLIQQMEDEARRALPNEACGLLTGIRAGTVVFVCNFQPCVNVTTDDPTQTFEIDPEVYFELARKARTGEGIGAEGIEQIVGVWHSHPTSLAQPSSTDQARSLEVDWLWLITGRVDTASTNEESPQHETRAFIAGANNPHLLSPIAIKYV